ncbi:MAG: hypothetical protein HF976_03945 [ANME-2 cluster archaeon]|nr:hypothetical protein [ANME-2 cluster archaeon]MBC2700558.1 hypothetical protein [ANME-2 cluster archaeon]MBC2706742.1 hypothetical protein [ANME-2 cluster archaeon]MBC2748063.1 hypothetical protein [ANME-2 cluster archaeon]MBC2763417.1 hypothetical protein [ANME-2 cluster archaeon]
MRIRNFAILSILLAGLAVSGCTGPSEEIPASPPASPTSTATPTPAQTGDVMDSEISTIELDMTELDALLADMERMQDMNFTQLEGLDF